MSAADDEAPAGERPRRVRWWRWLAGILLGMVAIVALALVAVDTPVGHRFVGDAIGRIRTANGLRFTVGRIDGSLYSDTRIVDLKVYDLGGLLFEAPKVELDWSPLAWFSNRLDITRLAAPQATLFHAPKTRKTGRRGPILPGFDIHIGALSVERLTIAAPVTGRARTGRLAGSADIRSGRAVVRIDAVVAGSDRLALAIDAEPARNRFDIEVKARGAADGLMARLTHVAVPVALDVTGEGSWARWRGTALARVGDAQVADLKLGAEQGRYTLTGTVSPSDLLKGKLQRLTAPRVLVNGSATYAERLLEGQISLRSAALAVDAAGGIDLAQGAYRRVGIRTRLLRPSALFGNMSGQGVVLKLDLDGAFAAASFRYALSADRFAFDKTGFERPRATGEGKLSPSPVSVPIRFTAAQVTGAGNVAGGILRGLSVEGLLRLTPKLLTGDDLKLRSDKLTGRIGVTLDLKTGVYQVGLNGALGRYLIPGIGIVDVTSTLKVVPGANGKGTRVIGRGEARVRRLDNGFFRSLTGGLPAITTGLERTPDGVLHFTNLVLTSPGLRLQGNGFRRRDGTFHFEGTGRQATYGPVVLKLDGDISKPTLDLLLASPNAALGLSGVRAHLDPTASGFSYQAQGGSRLGPFTANGAILLPKGQDARIAIDDLRVAGTRATGAVDVVTGGFDGRLAVAGGGLSGTIAFRPAGTVQRIEAHLDAARARFEGGISLRRGHLDLVTLLDPAGTTITAKATGQGLRQGALSLARFSAAADLSAGRGTLRATLSGSRGRAFDIRTVVQVTPGRYVVAAQGSLDKRPLILTTPAIVTTDDGGAFRIAPTRLSFAGGQATLAGSFGGGATALQMTLSQMPLSLLDIGYPDLGLGGVASGKLSFETRGGAAPTGRIDMTIRGLSRAGLVLSSRPIDVGVAGILSADRLGLRAVMASGGKTIGRAQALLSPLGEGDLAQRIARAPMFAQLRYGGPADTLWRLTGVELFDLSGPVAIGADVRGRIAAPVISGVVSANGARIESATTGTVLSNVQASGRFGGSRLIIDRLSADAGKGGRVTGTGQFDFAAAHGIGLDLSVQADKAVLINRDDIGATVTGPLTFRSNGTGGTIGGDVVLNRSRYRLGQATAATAVPKLNIREINQAGGGEEDSAPASPWTLAIHARAPNQLIVSGLGLSSEWSAGLTLGGAPDNPSITGEAKLIRGNYDFAGRTFELDRGIIRFSGQVPVNPALDIVANANSTGLNAQIRVTGVAQKPEISFTSTPALPEDELLSRLLFGTSITNLSAPEALQLAAAVAALRDGSGSLNPINAVRRAAGLDRLRILPADPQTGQGTSIAAGKYVTRRLYAEIVTDGQGYSATQVEYQVTRWLSLLSSISTLGRQSVNVRVSKDY